MLEINVKEARNNFSALLNRIEQGEEIIITRRGKKVARLTSPVPYDKKLISLKSFRDSIRIKGKPLSRAVVDNRSKERY